MKDFELFDIYRRENTHPNKNDAYCSVEHLLRFWREAKGEYLMPLFGDKLIMERPIEYTRTEDELNRNMEDMIHEQFDVITALSRALKNAAEVSDFYGCDEQAAAVHYLCDALQKCYCLVENRVEVRQIAYYMDRWSYDSATPRKSYQLKIKDKVIAIQDGQKITRLWGQIATLIGQAENWEKFRIMHSQVLNQKKLKGTLCLSIHPLDYATASDNDNGWSSCMSWREEGCYRMGTVEMMNSPMVICAYVRSDKQHMEIDGTEWNSKKWRAWIIVTKDAIICNRHYPYHQPEFAKQAINWVRDLVGVHYDWYYLDTEENFYRYMEQVDCEFEYHTNYMYNDLGGDDVIGCLNTRKHNPGMIMFSGKAECMVCGEEIHPDVQGADQLECTKCYSEYRCEECGCEISEDEVCYGPNGEPMCSSCWGEQCCTCSDCDETIWRDDSINVQFPVYQEHAKKFFEQASADFRQYFTTWSGRMRFPYTYGEEVCLCPDCARRYHMAEVDYDTKSDEVHVDWTLNVLDPTKTTMEDAFELIQPQGWNMTHNAWTLREQPELAEEFKKFWTDQWEAFKEDFINCPNSDDD